MKQMNKFTTLLLFIANLTLSANCLAAADNAQLMQKAQAALSAADYPTAFSLYIQAEKEESNFLAQFTLGLFYQLGWGRAVDEQAACTWFEKSAHGGIPAGQHFAGLCVERGVNGPADPVAAAHWFTQAAAGGHDQSLCNLGNLYMTGKGVAKDPNKALELCYRSAQQGVVPAEVWMGKFLMEGDESIRDVKQAYGWFEAAARKNEPEAFYYLGVIMRKGMFEGHTPLQARNMFEQAAALWYVPAYFPTGTLYAHAEPEPKTKSLSAEDLALAYLWLSATLKRSTDPAELADAKVMLAQIQRVMPKSWRPELDQKVATHLKGH